MTSLLPAIVLAGILPFGGDREAAPFPVEASGDIHFQLDAARFDPANGPPLEVYLSIPQSDLVASADSAGMGRVKVNLVFLDMDGDELARAEQVSWIPFLPPASGEAVLAIRHLMTLRPQVALHGSQILVRVEDLEGEKRGVVDRIRSRKPSGEARGRFEVEGQSPCGLSDIVFVWDVDRTQEAASMSVRRRIRPNPLRYYGLYHTTLLFYVEAATPAKEIRYRVRSVAERAYVAAGSDTARTATGGSIGFLEALDISFLPSGSYRLEVSRTGADSCASIGNFQILWDDPSWNQDRQALLEEAYVLLGNSEYEKVQDMSRGDIESYMRDLWGRHDPDPATGRNELHEEYSERVEHANQFYGTSFRKGMLSDRGRVYIRFGVPDEVTKELNPQDQDVISRVLPGEVEEDGYDIIRKPAPRASRDDRAYEIWTYQVRGQPLFPEQEVSGQHAGLKFIFVDDLGYGDMRLVYTNLSGGF
jgi:GWxTD domain-containing protein